MTSDYKNNDDYKIEPLTIKDSLKQDGERWAMALGNDPVERPAHYTAGNIECIDAMKEAFGKDDLISFCRLNAFKYLWRAKDKESEVQDIEKAIWYLKMSIGDDPREKT